MRIVKPNDWQLINSCEVDIIVEGTERLDLECVLYRKDDYFTQAPRERTILSRAPLKPFVGGVATARLSRLQGWGACVVSVVPIESGAELAASGLRLSFSETTTWLTEQLHPLPDEGPVSHILYPLPLVACTISHRGAEVMEDVTIVEDLADLLDPLREEMPVAVLPLLEGEMCDAMSVMDPAFCTEYSDPKAQQLRDASPYRASAPYLATFRNAYALLPAGVVFPQGTRIWSDSSVAAFFNDPTMTQYRRMFRANGEPGLVLDAIRTERDILKDNELSRMPGIPMLIAHIVYHNHAHWLLNSLPAVFWMREAIQAGQICVLVPSLSDYILQTLRSVDIPRSSIVLASAGTYCFEHLLFPSTLSIHANTCPPPGLAPMFKKIVTNLADGSGTPGAERIYITRLGSGTQRKIRNEPALIEALSERGFVCVAPHELSFHDEVRCFSRARIIVGQLGAGLTNIGFAPPGCRVIEITSHNYTGNDYWFMCYVLKHRFSRIMIRTEQDDRLTLGDFSFDVPLTDVLERIDRALETI